MDEADSGGEPSSSSSTEAVGAGAPPSAGSYTFAQEGWEELCRAGSCDRYDLAPQQRVEVDHPAGAGSVFRTTTRSSGSREQAITYRLTSKRLSISSIRSEFEYGAFRTTSEIVPKPPIVSARFPVRVGERWNGEWSDGNGKVDGDYSFRVIGRGTMTAGGSQRDVFILGVKMGFRGEFNGSSVMKVWLDSERMMIAASRGRTEITSSLGTYRTRFTTSLTDEP